MSQQAVETLPLSTPVKRQSVARLGRLCVVMNAYKTLYESTPGSGVFDTFASVGLAPPNAAPALSNLGAGNVTGVRGYLITFRNAATGHRSNPFDPDNPAAINAGAGSEIRVTRQDTNGGDNARFTHWEIWRNDDDASSTYYRLGQVAIGTTTYDDNATDDDIRLSETIDLDNDEPEAGLYDFAFTHKDRVFLVGPEWAIFSKLGNADAFPLVNRFAVERGMHGSLRLVTDIGDILVFMKDSALFELHYDANPSAVPGRGDGFGKTMTTKRGVVNADGVVNVEGVLYVMERNGIYQSRGGVEQNLLSPALHRLWQRINWDRREWFSSVQDRDRAVWFVALDGERECRYGITLDLASIRAGSVPRWFLTEYAFGVRHATEVRFDASAPAMASGLEWATVAAFMTEHGDVGYLVSGYRDLVDQRLSASGTVTDSAVDSLTDSNASPLEITELGQTVNVVGAFISFPRGVDADSPTPDAWQGQYRIAALDTGTGKMTVTPKFPSAPPVGTYYEIGAIPNAVLKSRREHFGVPTMHKVARRLEMRYRPLTEPRELRVSMDMDGRGEELAASSQDDGKASKTVNEPGVLARLGGRIQDEGRYGAMHYGLSPRGFRYGQVIFDASGIDKPFVVEGWTMELADAVEM
jgi:hypothetical protein